MKIFSHELNYNLCNLQSALEREIFDKRPYLEHHQEIFWALQGNIWSITRKYLKHHKKIFGASQGNMSSDEWDKIRRWPPRLKLERKQSEILGWSQHQIMGSNVSRHLVRTWHLQHLKAPNLDFIVACVDASSYIKSDSISYLLQEI